MNNILDQYHWVKQICIEHNLNVSKLADLSGISKTTLYDIVRVNSRIEDIQVKTLYKISLVINKPMEELIHKYKKED